MTHAEIDKLFSQQTEKCIKLFMSKLEWYKMIFRMFILSLGTITILIMAVIGWSYTPIKDIAVLKREVCLMSKKIDELVKDEKSKNEKTMEEIMAIKTPATQAICGGEPKNGGNKSK